MRSRLISSAVALLLLLTVAPSAGAATFTVDVTGDAGDSNTADNICDATTVGTQCTFRAAAEQANITAGTDNIHFAAGIAGQTIAISDPIVLTQTAIVNGCSSNPSSLDPCVGVDATKPPNTARITGLQMSGDAPDTTIRGLAITGAGQGIFNGFSSPRLALRNNWFGLRLDGSTVARNDIGVTITGNGATIGGSAAADRNVFVGNNSGFGTGIVVNGADDVVISGNHIGVIGGAIPAGLGVGIMSEGIATPPERLTIGGRVSLAASQSPACDEACNVISANGTNVDLGEERPAPNQRQATKVATIAGNYIGLISNGSTTPSPSNLPLGGGPGGVGIDVHHADSVTIGGLDMGDRNVITADGTGVMGWAGSQIQDLQVLQNYLGTDALGVFPLGELQGSAAWLDSNTAKPLWFALNLVTIGQLAGIHLEGRNALVANNQFGIGPSNENLAAGGSTASGIRITGDEADSTFGGNRITANRIGNAGSAGILIAGSDRNELFSNLLGVGIGLGAAPEPNGYGVLISETDLMPNSNVIGGNDPSEGNTISNSSRAAIGIFGGTANRVGHANGSNNGTAAPFGGFIDLGLDGPGNTDGSNEGVQAPQIVVAGTQAIFGTGTPGSTIRIYSKDTNQSGEVAGLRAIVTPVGEDGTWKGTYPAPSRPAEGQIVAATQTLASGSTSELSQAATTLPSTQDPTPPDTTITGPAATNDTTPAFSFGSTKAEGGYLCRVDGGSFKACEDPYGIGTPLAEGSHTIEAVAVDPDGIRDESPAVHAFMVDLTAPALAVAALPGPTRDKTPTLPFSGEGGAAFSCAVDEAAPRACSPPAFTPPSPLAHGSHTLRVVAEDAAGNQASAQRSFRIDSRPPQTRIVKGPPKVVRGAPRATAKIAFRSSERGSRFDCRVDKRAWKPCRSPRSFRLAPGRHVLRVRAIDVAGNRDRTPAKRVVTVTPAG